MPLLVLSAFVVLGVILGYAFALRSLRQTGGELKRYFDAFLSGGAEKPLSARVLGETLVCYFRLSLGLCVYRRGGCAAFMRVSELFAVVFSLLFCAFARAGELSAAAGAVRRQAAGGSALHAAAWQRVD